MRCGRFLPDMMEALGENRKTVILMMDQIQISDQRDLADLINKEPLIQEGEKRGSCYRMSQSI